MHASFAYLIQTLQNALRTDNDAETCIIKLVGKSMWTLQYFMINHCMCFKFACASTKWMSVCYLYYAHHTNTKYETSLLSDQPQFFTRCCYEILIRVDISVWRSWCRFTSCSVMLWISCSTSSQRCSIRYSCFIKDLVRPLKYTKLTVMFKEEVLDDVCFESYCIIWKLL